MEPEHCLQEFLHHLAGRVSLHVYSKPNAECDIYDTAEGLVRRVRLQYDSVPASR